MEMQPEMNPYEERDHRDGIQVIVPHVAIKATDLPKPLRDKWYSLSWIKGDRVNFSRAEIATIRPYISLGLQVAEAETVPASTGDFTTAIALVMAMPSQVTSDTLGDAAMMAYRIAVGDLPGDLLMKAATKALRDTKRTFRPSPPELRAYVVEEFNERLARKARLQSFANMPEPRPEPSYREQPDVDISQHVPAHDIVALLAKLDEGNRSFLATYAGGGKLKDFTPYSERMAAIVMPSTSDASPGLKALAVSAARL